MIFLSPLYNRPNTILERQRAVQSDHRATMYRLPRSKLYIGTFGTTFIVGMVGTVWGCYSLIKGKPAKSG